MLGGGEETRSRRRAKDLARPLRADDHVPRSNPPFLDQPVFHVGIGGDELFDLLGVVDLEDDHRLIDGIGERPSVYELPSRVSLLSHAQVLFSERTSAFEYIVDVIVEKYVIHLYLAC